MYDLFISYASEERRSVVLPIVNRLSDSGLKVWYDDERLVIGSSLLQLISQGLKQSRYGVVVLSRNFFLKDWPKYELDQLTVNKFDKILPVLHEITYKDLARHAPMVAHKRGVLTSEGLQRVCQEIIQVVQS